jgi:hypothetical protein
VLVTAANAPPERSFPRGALFVENALSPTWTPFEGSLCFAKTLAGDQVVGV